MMVSLVSLLYVCYRDRYNLHLVVCDFSINCTCIWLLHKLWVIHHSLCDEPKTMITLHGRKGKHWVLYSPCMMWWPVLLLEVLRFVENSGRLTKHWYQRGGFHWHPQTFSVFRKQVSSKQISPQIGRQPV